MIAMLRVHPSQAANLREQDWMGTDPPVPIDTYMDWFGNVCCRFLAPAGSVRLFGSTLIENSGQPDPIEPQARQHPVLQLPPEVLPFLYASRYCEVDRFADIAEGLFGRTPLGWPRVQAICTWVKQAVTFGYHLARPTKTALDVYTERGGVCRDFQHLAITFCRCMGIPARYATGYLGDIGVPADGSAMDFSAWFEAYLGDRWWTFDARHNIPRIGRVLIATGRDAADVAITTSFGVALMNSFTVITDEVHAEKPDSGSLKTQTFAGT
ncbi:MAG TPA: transglutaminase family protein [Bryobacteraceae bacterium]|jgi:transglutaminase-like putative cysteine protease|nr:transglutaminase family protein [Bryobacteraceae bacterium]